MGLFSYSAQLVYIVYVMLNPILDVVFLQSDLQMYVTEKDLAALSGYYV